MRVTEAEIERYNEMHLTKLLKRRYIRNTNEQAALLIQRQWKRYFARQLVVKREQRKGQAARRIQEAWREYRDGVLRPREDRKRRMKASLLLQRYLRGYMVHKKVARSLSEIKLKSCFDYFSTVRQRLLENSKVLIWYHWKKFKVSPRPHPPPAQPRPLQSQGHLHPPQSPQHCPPPRPPQAQGKASQGRPSQEGGRAHRRPPLLAAPE